jgi:hypothetical protein
LTYSFLLSIYIYHFDLYKNLKYLFSIKESKEAFLFDIFNSKLSNSSADFEWKLWKTILSANGNAEKIIDNFRPSQLADKVEWIIRQLKSENVDLKFPPLLASMFFSEKKTFSRSFLVNTLSDSFIAPKMISGIFTLTQIQIPSSSLFKFSFT